MVTVKIVTGIYRIRNKHSDKMYVGSSKNINERWVRHRYKLNKGTHDNRFLQNAWVKYGADAFEFEVIEQCDSEQLAEREQFWIDRLQVANSAYGYNLSKDTLRPANGLKHSPETLIKMSNAQKGRRHSEATKLQISKRRKGISNWSEEAKLNASLKRRGRRVSEETRQKMIQSALNRSDETEQKRHFARRRTYIITSPDGEMCKVKGLTEFCGQHGLTVSNMVNVASGKLKHHKGWKCRKVE